MIPLKKPYSSFYKLLDVLLIPGMYLIGGVFNEKPQETHNWNILNLPPSKKEVINPNLGVVLEGSYEGFLGKDHGGILFHFPIIGGWKEYVVFEANTPGPWHLGWFIDGMKKDYFQVSRLALHAPQVRALKPPKETTTLFFGVNEQGKQVPLKLVGEGTVGDGKFPHVRLL